jgi:Cu2+-exporting ATPase
MDGPESIQYDCMTASGNMICSHCLLPVGLRAMRRAVNGEDCAFCCYGCCIAFQVKHGKSEEWEAAWLLVRLGVGGFLSMNIMLFSLLLYSDAFAGADARLVPWIHILLWIFATPTVIILGGPFLRETWVNGLQARLTSSALIVIGVGAAYLYSAFAVIERGHHVYFDTATMVLMLFTLARQGGARSRAAVGRGTRKRRRGARRNRNSPPGTAGRGRHAGTGAAGGAYCNRRRRC